MGIEILKKIYPEQKLQILIYNILLEYNIPWNAQFVLITYTPTLTTIPL